MLSFSKFMITIQRSCSFQILFKQNTHLTRFGYAIWDQSVSVAEVNILSSGGTPIICTYRMASGVAENKKRWIFIFQIWINVEKSEYIYALEQTILL